MSIGEIINKIEIAQIALTRGNTEIKTLRSMLTWLRVEFENC